MVLQWQGDLAKKHMERSFGPGSSIIDSRHGNHSLATLESLPWYERCLNAPSMSTLMLVSNLCRWSFASSNMGGFQRDHVAAREASTSLLRALVDEATSRAKGSTFTLCFSSEWKCQWPRPIVEARFPGLLCEVRLAPGGRVQIGGLMNKNLCKGSVWRKLQTCFAYHGIEDHEEVLVVDVVQWLMNVPALNSVMAQLCLALARQLEASLGEAHRGVRDATTASLHYDDWLALDQADMDEKLVQYVLSGIEESTRHRVMSIATDKACPAGMSLQNSVICWPTNRMVLCPPQVWRQVSSARNRCACAQCYILSV